MEGSTQTPVGLFGLNLTPIRLSRVNEQGFYVTPDGEGYSIPQTALRPGHSPEMGVLPDPWVAKISHNPNISVIEAARLTSRAGITPKFGQVEQTK